MAPAYTRSRLRAPIEIARRGLSRSGDRGMRAPLCNACAESVFRALGPGTGLRSRSRQVAARLGREAVAFMRWSVHSSTDWALVVNGECVLRYDNERRKGGHRHIGGIEEPTTFTSLEALYDAFQADMERMLE